MRRHLVRKAIGETSHCNDIFRDEASNMIKPINPPDVVMPASNYAQGVVHSALAQRIVVSGQLGLRPDGTLEEGLEAQMERAWANLFAVLKSEGFEKHHLVKATVFVSEPGQVQRYRNVRDKLLGGHLVANTYLRVALLASPQFLVEIEGEAVKE
jgi:2-iminobutanoate/2-iminopropanoate deaminase